jgi:hypothetical protein
MNSSACLRWNKIKANGAGVPAAGFCSQEADYLYCYRGFKGLKQAIKLEFKLGRYSDVGDAVYVPPRSRQLTHPS